jgi:diguanylate cyclase (GGDEF)-like protein
MAGAVQLAERLRAALEQQTLHGAGTDVLLRCTATIGVSNPFASPDGLEGAMHEADTALYRGKAAGRNRVEAAMPPTDTSLPRMEPQR